ncbi:hypothetical protein [Parafrankia sp. EUN1f]|uniref:hypothetical protein n=1 Tax=Parafrankia sp. EUN1f TaxID=102897 RepID=UPI0001C45E84|nr:hypothetical protein [Parafrankia sp. EUN1f]EFC82716.1 hypothetical protein FrEUN1fDRAFT_4140 [Parafrankia sp. EUN1f]
MFDLLGVRPRPRTAHGEPAVQGEQMAPGRPLPSQRSAPSTGSLPGRPATTLPPSVARVAARTRLSAELLAAILTVDGRTRATLDDMERADALADVLLARRRERVGQHRHEAPVRPAGEGGPPLRWSA